MPTDVASAFSREVDTGSREERGATSKSQMRVSVSEDRATRLVEPRQPVSVVRADAAPPCRSVASGTATGRMRGHIAGRTGPDGRTPI